MNRATATIIYRHKREWALDEAVRITAEKHKTSARFFKDLGLRSGVVGELFCYNVRAEFRKLMAG